MELIAAVCAVAFVVLLFANEPDGGADSGRGDVDGAAVFAGNCARCHGSGGDGGVGPQLSDGAVVEAYPDPADQVTVVTSGRNGMPAFGDRLSPEEIESVVAFTRQL